MAKRKKRKGMSRGKKELRKRLRSEPAFKDLKIIEPINEEKLSLAIFQLVEPYKSEADNIQAFTGLITLAVMVWNVSILKGDEQKKMMKKIKAMLLDDSSQEWEQPLEQIVTQLIRRKKRYFAHDKRFIIDYEITESRDEFNLAVVSTFLE